MNNIVKVYSHKLKSESARGFEREEIFKELSKIPEYFFGPCLIFERSDKDDYVFLAIEQNGHVLLHSACERAARISGVEFLNTCCGSGFCSRDGDTLILSGTAIEYQSFDRRVIKKLQRSLAQYFNVDNIILKR